MRGAVLLGLAAAAAAARGAPPTLPSAAAPNICGTNATIGAAVLAALNLTYPGLEAVSAAAAAGDLNTACDKLALYYAAANTSAWLRVPAPAPGTRLAGGLVDAMVFNDSFWVDDVYEAAVIPRNADGGLDWLCTGPSEDIEFMNGLNRFYFNARLLAAWRATGNPVYPRYFDALVRDWVTHLPCPGAGGRGAACVPLGVGGGAAPVCDWAAEVPPGAQACATGTMESPWRSLEMGIRMGDAWPAGFFGFQAAAEFSTSARVLAVLAVSEHNAALAADGGHPGEGTPNWEMTQWQGLATSALSFPELRNASGLLALALGYLDALLTAGVYPDGVETEQSSHYHMVSAGDFLSTLTLLADAGAPAAAPAFAAHVEAMWAYGAYASDPTGFLPQNGDSDACGSGYQASVAALFNRSDWTYRRGGHAAGRHQRLALERLPVGGAGGAARRLQPRRDVGLVRRGPLRLVRPRAPRQAVAAAQRARLRVPGGQRPLLVLGRRPQRAAARAVLAQRQRAEHAVPGARRAAVVRPAAAAGRGNRAHPRRLRGALAARGHGVGAHGPVGRD